MNTKAPLAAPKTPPMKGILKRLIARPQKKHRGWIIVLSSILFIAVVILLLYIIGAYGQPNHTAVTSTSSKHSIIKNFSLVVEIADTEEKRVQGLSGRESLPETEGMLFVWEEAGIHGIWMKDMKFPIDIIWIDENLRVIALESDVSPDTYPETFRPNEPAQYILETNAGWIEKNGVILGDVISLPQ